jgi:tRNA A-37 threonylcarbamoyl transferase component Bud32
MFKLVTLTAGGLRWQVPSEYRDLLLGSNGLRLEEWLQAGLARAVKHGPHCTVYRVVLPGLDFHLKHYRLFNTQAWLRQMIRPAKARTEFERGLAVAGRNVPTITPLGVGDHGGRPGDSFLLTHTVDAQPLGAFLENELPRLEPPRQAKLRKRLAHELGRLLAHMHAAGVVHHDLHAGNLLLRLDAGARPALFLIDLHTVRVGAPLDWEARRDNLIIMNRWFVLRAERSDRRRFWEAYATAWRGPATTAGERELRRDLARDLEEGTWESNLAFWRNRDRRSRASNRYYHQVRSAAATGHAVRELDSSVLAELLANPDHYFDLPGVKTLKNSRSSTVVEFNMPDTGTPVIYKRFRVTTWSDPWTALVRPSSALRSWIFGHGLRERGLPTPRPLLMLHRRSRGLDREGYLLTEKLPDARDLHTYLAELLRLPVRERRVEIRRVIERLGRLILALHRRNLSQRDLKATNILVSPQRCAWSVVRDSDPSGPHLWFIDLVGLSRHDNLSRQRRVQNLARLHASFHQHPELTRTDRLRFLRIYLEWGLSGQAGWKRWWHEVNRATKAKIERNRKSGRPLT